MTAYIRRPSPEYDARNRFLRALALIPVLAVASSCGDPTGPGDGIPAPPDVRPWVTGAAAAGVDANGHFRLPEPVAPGAEPIVDRRFAADLALGFIRTWVIGGATLPGLGSIRDFLEEEHGGPIDWSAIQLEDRLAYYAESPYQELPDSVPIWTRRFYGPSYLLPIFEGGEQVAHVSVAAYTTDLWIDGEGRVRRPRHSGNEFFAGGTPPGLPFRIPLLPEHAVQVVAEATGARVSEVPVLIGPERPRAEIGARWRLALDREIDVLNVDTGDRERTRVVYLGVWGPPTRIIWYLPTPEQPRTERIRYSVPTSSGDSLTRHETDIHFRTDVPARFHEIVPVTEAG